MTKLFQQIEDAVAPLPGWATVEKTQRMAAMVLALQPTISCEIGVFGGKSFFGLALAHKFLGHGTVIGIDPWTNEAAVEGYEGDNKTWWGEQHLDKIHADFMQQVHLLGVQNVVNIWRMKSDAADPPPGIGVLSLDGQHTEQAVRDVKRYAANVCVGGFVIMDDLNWKNADDTPVQRAVRVLLEMGFRSMYPLGTGEVFQRV